MNYRGFTNRQIRANRSHRRRAPWWHWLFLLVGVLSLANCQRRNPEQERRQAVNQTLEKLQACLRPQATVNQTPALAPAQLALRDIHRAPSGGTRARLVAYTGTAASEFYLPTYSLSRGRWLINEKERVYLLDESCQEYKLQDRHSTNNQPLPLNGQVALPPGTAFEFALSFPNLPPEIQMGVLVYGARAIPFSLLKSPAPLPD